MSQAISPQHPAMVMRSRYLRLRALLAITCIAIAGLTVAVVMLATRSNGSASVARSAVQLSSPAPGGTVRYDGGPEEGTRGPVWAARSATIRYDGGPEEGSRGPGH
jgi:hypothetical protein